MSDYDRNFAAGRVTTDRAAVVDAGLRAHMLRVYNYMAIGVALTGLVAWFTFQAATVTTAGGGLAFTEFGRTLFNTPLIYVAMFGPLAFVLVLSFGVNKLSPAVAQALFFIYAATVGISLSVIFLAYTQASITRVFFITAAAFGGLSLWGYVTQRDLTAMGSFMMMGLFGILIAMVVNIFLKSTGLDWLISIIGVIVFAGLTAYDTQKIKELYDVNDDGSVTSRKAVMGALSLYLDFINLFMMLLRLFGNRR